MCEVCEHIQVNVAEKQYDPTRTTALRNMAVGESNRRFDHIVALIRKAVDAEDVFGLRLQALQTTPGQNAFAWGTNDRKIREFIRWINDLIRDGILVVDEIPTGFGIENWLQKYLKTAYQRGLARAREELRKAGYNVPTVTASGGLATVMSIPIHVDALAMLYVRAFSDLKGITAVMEQHLTKLLTEGFMSGANPRVIARRLVAAINGKGVGDLGLTDSLGRFISAKRRAELLARTEIIRAHHTANINEYMSWGALGVSVKAEWSTAGDSRVCFECQSLEGQVFTLEEILPMIPLHPQCFIDPQVPVYTSKGWKPIGKVEVGDLVLTHKKRFRKVYGLPRTEKQKPEVVKITFSTGKTFTVTANHLIRVKNGRFIMWVEAGKIKEGDAVIYLGNITKNYHTLGIKVRKIEKWNLQKARTLYNLSVEEDESYIAKGVVVHNCRCLALPIAKITGGN